MEGRFPFSRMVVEGIRQPYREAFTKDIFLQAGVQYNSWQAKLYELDLLELPQDAEKRRATPNPATIQRKVAQLQSSHPRIVSSVL